MTRELWLALSILGMWAFAVLARVPGCPPEWSLEPIGTAVTLGTLGLALWIVVDRVTTAFANFWDRWISP